MIAKTTLGKIAWVCLVVNIQLVTSSALGQNPDWGLHPPPLSPTNDWGAITNQCQVGLRVPKFQYESGEPIVAFVVLRNLSDKPIGVSSTSPYADYDVIVTRTDNQNVPYTDWWNKEKNSTPFFRALIKTVDPRQQMSPALIDVTARYKMDPPGEYIVVTRQHLNLFAMASQLPRSWKPLGHFDLVSNPVTITVIPKPDK